MLNPGTPLIEAGGGILSGAPRDTAVRLSGYLPDGGHPDDEEEWFAIHGGLPGSGKRATPHGRLNGF
jgi:hypothetical protein